MTFLCGSLVGVALYWILRTVWYGVLFLEFGPDQGARWWEFPDPFLTICINLGFAAVGGVGASLFGTQWKALRCGCQCCLHSCLDCITGEWHPSTCRYD